MARLYLRGKEAVLVLGVTRMALNVWERKGKIRKVTKNPRHVYYIVQADIQSDGKITNAKPMRPKNANPKR
jgi:predicted site-specific integrase-resolvase